MMENNNFTKGYYSAEYLKSMFFFVLLLLVFFWRYGCLFLFLGAVVVMSAWLLDFRTTYVISAYHH